MLDKLVGFVGVFVIFMFCFFSCVILYVGMVKWFQLQGEASLLASGMAQYGGYTNILNNQLHEFCANSSFESASLSVIANPSGGPVPYGQTVSISMSYPFDRAVNLGPFSGMINLSMKANASGISHYLQSAVTGTSPISVFYCAPAP